MLELLMVRRGSYYDNGTVKNVAHRECFQEALKGNRDLNDPLESTIEGK